MRQHKSQQCTRSRRPATRLRCSYFSPTRCLNIAVGMSCLSVLTRAFMIPKPHINFAITKSISTIHEVASNEMATEPITSRSQLDKMTVKQLKVLMLEQGIPSRPGNKLKKDVIDCIWDYYQNVGVDAVEEVAMEEALAVAHGDSNIDVDSTVNGSITKKKPAKMPPLGDISSGETNVASITGEPYHLTPKDRIVLDVLERYPPLHDAIIAECAAVERTTTTDGVIESVTEGNIEQCELSTLMYQVPSGLAENDMRQMYHPVLKNATQSDLDIVFVGTASCTPGVTRGVSCTAVRVNYRSKSVYTEGNDIKTGTDKARAMGTWLFDCGEATQLSIQKTSNIKPGKISKIFITHCHGDHSFGLPGLLCLMGTDRDQNDPPIEIYGPEGLRMWLRVAIRYSVSRVVPPYRVHELMDVPMAPEWEQGHRRNGRFYFQVKKEGGGHRWGTKGLAGEDPNSWISRAPMVNLEPSRDFGEINGGQDIYPIYDHPQCADGAPVWEVISDGDVTVNAAPMSHAVPCVGYVVHESDSPGKLRPENVLPVIERNREGLKEAGVKNPMKVMAMVKSLPMGGSYTFPDGTVIRQEDVVEPPRKGRKIVICGDTADCRAMEGLAQGADVLVHEATNTFLPGVDKEGNIKMVTRDTKIHGHSTPLMAGQFAKKINAKKLILNHFSARYKGDQSLDSLTIMTRMERQAIKASELPEDSVACAWDFMLLPVSRK